MSLAILIILKNHPRVTLVAPGGFSGWNKNNALYWAYMARCCQCGSCWSGVCEKGPGAAPVLDTASFSQLQDGPTAAKANLFNNTGGTSVITHVRKSENWCTAAVRERSEKNVRETTLHTLRPVEKERQEVLQ